MKILSVSTYDTNGGAALAAYRLHQGLTRYADAATLLVEQKDSDDFTVVGPQNPLEVVVGKLKRQVNRLPLSFYRRKKGVFSPVWFPAATHARLRSLAPDIVHLNWIGGGILPPSSFPKLEMPVVWTLHDMWAFTGGCHYAGDCDRYIEKCGHCPSLGSRHALDLSRWMWRLKKSAYAQKPLTIVAPSRWLASCAQKSSLLKDHRIEVIPYGFDLDVFAPMERRAARNLLNLPEASRLILFGAMNATSDTRKGFQFLLPGLNILAGDTPPRPIELLVFGASTPQTPPAFPFETHYMGPVADALTLRVLYAAADLVVVPSMEDNLPLVALEAAASGTPVVAFDVGGLGDIVVHKETGYLARPYDTAELAQGMRFVLDHPLPGALQEACRRTALSRFSLKAIVDRYLALYEALLAHGNATDTR